MDAFLPEFIHNPEEKEVRRICRLLRISAQDPKAGVLVNSGVLKESQVRIGYAFTGNDLHINLNSFSGMGHLLVRFRLIGIFLLHYHEPLTPEHSPEGFNASGVSSFAQFAPEFDHAKTRIAAFHIVDKLQLRRRVLIRMMVWASRFRAKRFNASIPAVQPEVDVGSSPVVLSAGLAYAMCCCVLHKGLLVVHVLCYSCHAG
jgi:hypothetical protein